MSIQAAGAAAEARRLASSDIGSETGADDTAEMEPDGAVVVGADDAAEMEPDGETEMGVDDAAETARGDAMEMTAERKTAILGAMKNFSLPYFPAWALHVPEEQWVGALRNPSAWQPTASASHGDQAEPDQPVGS